MKKYRAEIKIRGNNETKGFAFDFIAQNDTDANSKAWQRLTMTVKEVDPVPDNQSDICGIFKDIFGKDSKQ